MKGDFTRNTFHPEKHYSGVLMQQGRVRVDADWNEQQAITRYRLGTEAQDVIGPCGAPEGNAGFGISPTPDGSDLIISPGRIYVDGILCENDTDRLPYDEQPDFPRAPNWRAVLEEAGASIALVYLDVWRRHVTALDDPLIREVALGGPDTATRVKTLWQVKVMPLTSPDATCDQWPDGCAPLPISTGTLNARTKEIADVADPCLLPPTAGYKRLENQLYRVEIHDGGALGKATFKWSRDNGTIVTGIEGISGSDVTVHDLGRDEVLGFAVGQWVEISDDVIELHGDPGKLVQIQDVDAANRVITLSAAPSVDMAYHPKLRRWDSQGTISVEIPADNNGWIELEGGIEVQFSEGIYKTGDYWLIPARTATEQIEWPPDQPGAAPIPQPPLGIEHHYCRLALVHWTEDAQSLLVNDTLTVTLGQPVVTDCRHIFPPLTEITSGGGHGRYVMLRYVGGDGQEGRPGDNLPCTLAVGVENERGRPVQGVSVIFSVDKRGCGSLSDAQDTSNSGTNIAVATGSNGIAEVRWTLGPEMTVGQCCRVTARLAQAPLGRSPEIHFKATARPAGEARDWPRIEEINWINDQSMDLGTFNDGLQVTFSEDMDPQTVTSDTFIVTVELPTIEPPILEMKALKAQARAIKAGDAYPVHRLFVIPGMVTRFNDEQFTWIFKPAPPISYRMLSTWLATRKHFFPELVKLEGLHIRCRVLLTGNAILSAEEGMPLDGEAIGLRRQDDSGNGFTDLALPSGDGHKGGDFESWFYLVLG